MRRGVVLLFFAASLCIPVAALGAIVAIFYSVGQLSEPQPVDPKTLFPALTNWPLPPDARIIKAENTHEGFKNDGNLTLIVQVSPRQLNDWLNADPQGMWSETPVPEEIRSNWRGAPSFEGSLYRTVKVLETDHDWHRGTIIVVAPDTGAISIYGWKS